MKKVLLINDYLHCGGAEAVFRSTQELVSEECEVQILYGEERPLSSINKGYFYSFHHKRRLQKELDEFQPDVIHIHNCYYCLTPSIFQAIARYKKQHSVKVLVTLHDYQWFSPSSNLCHYSGSQLTNFENIPTIGQWWLKRLDPRGAIHSLATKMKWVLHFRWLKVQQWVDYFIAPSEFMLDFAQRAYGHEKCSLVRNPIASLDRVEPISGGNG